MYYLKLLIESLSCSGVKSIAVKRYYDITCWPSLKLILFQLDLFEVLKAIPLIVCSNWLMLYVAYTLTTFYWENNIPFFWRRRCGLFETFFPLRWFSPLFRAVTLAVSGIKESFYPNCFDTCAASLRFDIRGFFLWPTRDNNERL